MKSLTSTLVAVAVTLGAASAASISINFAENAGNQSFAGGTNLGPLGTDSSNWNNTADGGLTLTGDTINGLIDDSGAATTANITWSAQGVWYNDQGISGDANKQNVGYLDDGLSANGPGIQITVTNIPYAQYKIYGLFSSDIGNTNATVTLLDFDVNSGNWVFGGAAADNTLSGYGSIADNNAAHGTDFTEITSSVIGNYWTMGGLTSSTLTIDGQTTLNGGNVPRGTLSGLIIEQVPEPSSAALLGLGGLALILRRRK